LQPVLSVLLCTHNPRADLLSLTLASLSAQTFDARAIDWELIIIDNASAKPLAGRSDIVFPANARIVHESNLGLTHARRRSFFESRGEILVYIDDDNVLAPDYLARSVDRMMSDQLLGALGGRVLPSYETPPPDWFHKTGIELACRDLGLSPLAASWKNMSAADRIYPNCAPIGAGMVLRREAYATYVRECEEDPIRLGLGRRGQDLASGEDNDMVMTILRNGWTVAYDPGLVLTHLIPASRLERDYLRRYAYASNRTWVQVLGVHGICPWSEIAAGTTWLRKARAYLRTQPWRGPVQQIAWAAACGQIDGRARLKGIRPLYQP
jgi:glycosyltransferase involved in cell wall biosynthesis